MDELQTHDAKWKGQTGKATYSTIPFIETSRKHESVEKESRSVVT